MNMPSFFKRDSVRDILQLLVFGACIIIGVVVINSFIFRSFSVAGASMEQTLHSGDRLIVNRIPVTIASAEGKEYTPNRGEIIVFKNPHFTPASGDEFIVKRVIAFGGERVVLKDGHYTVYNSTNPLGFNPDDMNDGEPGSPTVGSVDVTVPDGQLFVSGDHRQLDPNGNPYSLDSRNGLGYIPIEDIVGPVGMRIYPFQGIRTFK